MEPQSVPVSPAFADDQDDYNEEPSSALDQVLPTVHIQYPQQTLEEGLYQVAGFFKAEDVISRELEIKYETAIQAANYEERRRPEALEEILRLRMNELALAKILVNTHSRSMMALVISHHHMGSSYLRFKCYEQAQGHITSAIKLNSKVQNLQNSKLYHSYLLLTLSRCYYEISSFSDTLQVLKRANEIQQSEVAEDHPLYNTDIIVQIAMAELKYKLPEVALEYLEKAEDILRQKWNKVNILSGSSSEPPTVAESPSGNSSPNQTLDPPPSSSDTSGQSFNNAQALYYAQLSDVKQKKASVLAELKNYEQAIKELQQATNLVGAPSIYSINLLSQCLDSLVGYYTVEHSLSKAVQTLQRKVSALGIVYEEGHIKAVQARRKLCTLMIENREVSAAIIELNKLHVRGERESMTWSLFLMNFFQFYPKHQFQSIMLQKTLELIHGSQHLQVIKTMKDLGFALMMTENEKQRGEQILKKAMKILVEIGSSGRTFRELKAKLDSIKK